MPFFTTNGGVEQFYCDSPTKDLMRVLIEKTEAAGRILTSEEFAKYPELPKPNHYAYYFGSFSEAAKRAYMNTEHYKNARTREKSEPKRVYQKDEVRRQDWMDEIAKDFRAEETPPEPSIEESLNTKEESPEAPVEEALSIEEGVQTEESRIEEVQVVKHESDSGEVTIEVTVPLNLKKPIKIILIPA